MQTAVDTEIPSVHRIIKCSLWNENVAGRTEVIPEEVGVDYQTKVIQKDVDIAYKIDKWMKTINVDAADITEINMNGVEITNQPKHADVILKDNVILKEVTLHVKLTSLRQIST